MILFSSLFAFFLPKSHFSLFLSLKPVSKLQNICFINTVKISIIFFRFKNWIKKSNWLDNVFVKSALRHRPNKMEFIVVGFIVVVDVVVVVKSTLRSDDNDCEEQNWDQIKWRSLKSAATAGLHQGRQVSWNKKNKKWIY